MYSRLSVIKFLIIQTFVVHVWSASVLEQSRQLLQGVKIHPQLHQHSQEFDSRHIIKVNDLVYVGVGYGIANCIFILAPEGLIIVDSMESTLSAKAVFTDFKKTVSNATVKAVIYTHFHGDHNEGTRAFISDPPPDVWAHRRLAEELERHSVVGPILFRRGIRQFGILLPQELPWYLNNGIGPSGASFFESSDREVVTSGIVWPNRFMEGKDLEVEIAGLPLHLFNMPGETPDQIGVWIPSVRTFMCGDNLYKTYPNIYTIRGTTDRDPLLWVQSLDEIRGLEPEYLVPSHTKPVLGKQLVYETLTKYRDGIQILHDQTIRYINLGYSREEAAKMVKLPPKQEKFPYLQQFYGTLEWSSKAVHNKYMGWFDGKPEELSPLTPKEQSKRVVKLAGGARILINRAQKSLDASDYQWALELSTHVTNVQTNNFTRKEAFAVRRAALIGLAEQQSSPNGRYFYLTTALEDRDVVSMHQPQFTHFAQHLPIDRLFRFLSFWLKPEEPKCGLIDTKLLFNFINTKEMYVVEIRNGIVDSHRLNALDIREETRISDCVLNGETVKWREFVGQEISYSQFWNEFKIKQCSKPKVQEIFECFEFFT